MRVPIDRRVIPGGIILAVIALILFKVSSPLFVLACALIIFHFSFFRDPLRKCPAGQSALSPADGTVVAIETVREDQFLMAEAYKIGIFLSIFNAHVNRAPTEGIIEYWHYQKGQFLNALQSDSAELNECLWLGMTNQRGKTLTRLIAGAIARRICCDVAKDSQVARGEKIGIICYGSRAELYVPKNKFRIFVKLGDKVKAGKTILGDWDHEA